MTALLMGPLVLALGGCGAVHRSAPLQPWLDGCQGKRLSVRWLVASDNWSKQDAAGKPRGGGTVAGNIDVSAGRCRLWVRGDQYVGPVRGTDGQGRALEDGRRSGAAIATRAYHGSGRFSVRLKVPTSPGVVVGIWTLHYSEAPPDPWLPDGPVVLRNHEIDIEIIHPAEGRSELWVSTALGVGPEDKTTYKFPMMPFDDAFHVLCFDWRSGPHGYVRFSMDDRPVGEIHRHVPHLAGRLWLGAWVPDGWAGAPAFESAVVEIDWIRVEPTPTEYDRFEAETDDGFLWDHQAVQPAPVVQQ